MSFALTFGGFGDFACLTQLILTTCKVLVDSFDATTECNALVEYLTSFNNALESVRPLIKGNPLLGPQVPVATINALRTAVSICEREIRKFEKRIVALRNSDDHGFKARLGAAAQRLKWTMSLNGAAAHVRRTLAEQKGVIELILAASMAQETASWALIMRGTPLTRAPASNGVELVDILDQHITVPIECCFSFETFNAFLLLLCKERAGAAYVRAQAYCLTVYEESSAAPHDVSSENWNRYVGCGVVLEMAVRSLQHRSPRNACPSCGFVSRDSRLDKKAHRCSFCQTVVAIQEQGDTREAHGGATDPESHQDWRYIRRVRYEYTWRNSPRYLNGNAVPVSSLLSSKPFKCPKPSCNKSFKLANGLKYHMTHGSCSFAPPKDLEQHQALPASFRGQKSDEGEPLSDAELREVEKEAERRLRPYACGVGDCQRRYQNMKGLRYHYQHSGDHGAIGLALLASGQHEYYYSQHTKSHSRHVTTANSTTAS